MLKANDKVKFTSAPPHGNEMKDWAELAGVEEGETYTIFAVEPPHIRLEGFKYWHHDSRFELIKSKDKEKKEGKDEKV